MHLEVLTPQKRLFEGTIVSVQLSGTKGSFQILNNHAPFLSSLGKGKIKIETTKNSTPTTFSIEKGFVQVVNNKTIILIDKAVS